MGLNLNWPSWLKGRRQRSLLRGEDVAQKERVRNGAARHTSVQLPGDE